MRDTNKYWIISSRPDKHSDLKLISKAEGYSFYSNMDTYAKEILGSKIIICIEGYILPKLEYAELYSNMNSHDLVFALYEKFGYDLIKYIKGNFNLILIGNDSFCVFNDHFGLSKFFIFKNDNIFSISNKYSLLSKYCESGINKIAITKFILFQHFTNKETLFEEIIYSKEATKVIFDLPIKISNYWSSNELIFSKRENVKFEEFVIVFNNIIKNFIQFLKPKGISLTLTGGRDTRTILSSLLNNGIRPDTYTFGNPNSNDVNVSQNISNELELNFNNYYINPNYEWYNRLTGEISGFDNPLIHLHRGHRLDAYKQDVAKSGNEMIFMGSMGGDYIKGAHLDDYIISSFVRKWYFEDFHKDATIKSFLEDNFVKSDCIMLPGLREYLSNIEYNDGVKKNMEFKFVHNLVGEIHDYQDIFLASKVYKFCITPFIDIDFLNLLFSSKYCLFDNFYASKNPFLMLKGSELQCEIINSLYPLLSGINFAAGYTPKDVLGNSFKYILKRIYLSKIKKQKGVQNFAYTDWMVDYVKNNMEYIDMMGDIFDVEKLKFSFKHREHKTTEGYWHKYTNIVMFGMMREKYEDGDRVIGDG